MLCASAADTGPAPGPPLSALGRVPASPGLRVRGHLIKTNGGF